MGTARKKQARGPIRRMGSRLSLMEGEQKMRSREIIRLKQALSQTAAEESGKTEDAGWMEPSQWIMFMGKQARGELYAAFSNEELLSILRETAERLGHNPSKKEVFCVYRVFLIERFGNWPKALVAAGLKRPRKERREANRRREIEAMKRNTKWKQSLMRREERPHGKGTQETYTLAGDIAATISMEGGAG